MSYASLGTGYCSDTGQDCGANDCRLSSIVRIGDGKDNAIELQAADLGVSECSSSSVNTQMCLKNKPKCFTSFFIGPS
eukprot:COSAG02_NODE_216_length_28610_cov_57.176879_9_plen_78_part_00